MKIVVKHFRIGFSQRVFFLTGTLNMRCFSRLAILLALLSLTLAGCGGDDPFATSGDASSESASDAETAQPTSASDSVILDATAHAVEMTTLLNEMTTVLNAVSDEESAKAAAPKITALFKAYDEAGAKWGAAVAAALAGKAETPSDYAQDYAQKEKEWHAAVQTFGIAMDRVRNLPAAQAHLKPVFDRRDAME